MSLKSWLTLGAALTATSFLSGCIVAAAATGGYIAADEIAEDDGEFDPFEDVIDDILDEEDGEDG